MSIQVQGLSKRFGNHVVVRDLNVEIADGEFFVLLGPSGCGKSTTLRMIAGLDAPSAGRVHIHGRDVTHAEPRHRDIAMVFQDYGLYPNMTVFQNIEFPLKVRKLAKPERWRKVIETAERLGIADLLKRKPGKISGGQRQRVSLARALVRSPHAFLMDEPLSNLDAALRASMRTEIKQLVANLGITTVYVTHDQVEAMSMADRIGIMRDGDMIQVGRPLEVYDGPRSKFVARFIGSPPMNLFPAEFAGRRRIECPLQPLADALPEVQRARATALRARGLPFLIGVRPENLAVNRADGAHAIAAEVEFIEPLGQTTNLHLRAGETHFVVVSGRTSIEAGARVGVAVRPEDLCVVEDEPAQAPGQVSPSRKPVGNGSDGSSTY
jgi:multiple sugar transport system ATP-binding protein